MLAQACLALPSEPRETELWWRFAERHGVDVADRTVAEPLGQLYAARGDFRGLRRLLDRVWLHAQARTPEPLDRSGTASSTHSPSSPSTTTWSRRSLTPPSLSAGAPPFPESSALHASFATREDVPETLARLYELWVVSALRAKRTASVRLAVEEMTSRGVTCSPIVRTALVAATLEDPETTASLHRMLRARETKETKEAVDTARARRGSASGAPTQAMGSPSPEVASSSLTSLSSPSSLTRASVVEAAVAIATDRTIGPPPPTMVWSLLLAEACAQGPDALALVFRAMQGAHIGLSDEWLVRVTEVLGNVGSGEGDDGGIGVEERGSRLLTRTRRPAREKGIEAGDSSTLPSVVP